MESHTNVSMDKNPKTPENTLELSTCPIEFFQKRKAKPSNTKNMHSDSTQADTQIAIEFKRDLPISTKNTAEDLEQGPIPSSSSEDSKSQPEKVDDTIRRAFVRKVLLILTAQILVSAFMVGMTFFPNGVVKNFMLRNSYLAIISTVLGIILLIALVWKRENLQKVPRNYILLTIFTVCMSYSLAFLASFSNGAGVLIAAGLTFLIVVSALIYVSMSKKKNFSKLGLYLAQIIPLFFALPIIGYFFPGLVIRALIGAGIVTFLALHLTFEIVRVMGRCESKYSVDDYILAALDIYIDIYLIFLELLKIFGGITQ
jgi:FtsH-binding integral membrane protein